MRYTCARCQKVLPYMAMTLHFARCFTNRPSTGKLLELWWDGVRVR